MIAVSIVSHGHGSMVGELVCKVLDLPEVSEVLLTLNVPEDLQLPHDERLRIVRNSRPKGFGANHNTAFAMSAQPYFCPMNPDIGLKESSFPPLMLALANNLVGLAAPRVNAPNGRHEDSWRYFPTLRSLFAKFLGKSDGRYTIPANGLAFSPDWVAGMFMLFRSAAFRDIGGFDEGFFLYYEDVDICVRLWKSGYRIVAVPEAVVVHDAQRDSHRSGRHLRWHLASMARYFLKHWGRLPRSTGNIA